MKKFIIPKKSGGNRTIYAPNFSEKARLRLEVIKLNERVKSECNNDVVHGFVLGRSPVTNAIKHINYQYSLSVDLKDFFDSVGSDLVLDLSDIQNKICFIEGKARQGLPTSPAISNLSCINIDKYLSEYCLSNNIIYTRYADDLTFSSNNINILLELRNTLSNIVLQYGFEINHKKTRIQYAKFGRRNITGVMVDNQIHPSREVKRKLRAAKHQNKKHQIKGLKEWCKLKLPKPEGSDRISKVKKTFVRHLVRKIIDKKEDVWII